MENINDDHSSKGILVAKIISYLFHPLFVPTYGLLIVFFSNQLAGFNSYAMPEVMATNQLIFLIVIVFTMLIPGISAIALKRLGKIKSLQMQSRQERLLPFAITACSYLAAYSIIQNFLAPVNQMILVILIGAQTAILFALIITSFWKVSIHMIAIGGLIGTELLMINLAHASWELLLYGTILIAGFIGFARLRLNAHQPAQVLIGFLLGVLTEAIFLLAN